MVHDQNRAPAPCGEAGVSVARTIFCVGVFYAVMVCFNGAAMQESATLTEFGWRRDTLCRLNRPLETISRFTGGYRLRAGVRTTVGRWLNRDGR